MFIPSCLCKQDLYDYDALQIMKQDAYVKHLCKILLLHLVFISHQTNIYKQLPFLHKFRSSPSIQPQNFPMFFFLGKKCGAPKKEWVPGNPFSPPHAGCRDSKTKTPEIRKAKALGSLRRIKHTHKESDLGWGMVSWELATRWPDTLPETNVASKEKPLKIGRLIAPKGNEIVWTNHPFSGAKMLFVSGRITSPEFHQTRIWPGCDKFPVNQNKKCPVVIIAIWCYELLTHLFFLVVVPLVENWGKVQKASKDRSFRTFPLSEIECKPTAITPITSEYQDMGVSKNRGTPKWMVYNGTPC